MRIHEKKINTGCAIAQFVSTYLAEVQALGKCISLKQIEDTVCSSYEWVPVRIYFDGAFDARNSKFASEVIVSESIEGDECSEVKIFERVSSSFEAEAIACREAVRLGIAKGWPEVAILGDALSIIKKCQKDSWDSSLLHAYIDDIHHLKQFFQKITFHYIPRLENLFAHNAAIEMLRGGRLPNQLPIIPLCDRSALVTEEDEAPD